MLRMTVSTRRSSTRNGPPAVTPPPLVDWFQFQLTL
jgi:hypothetical protein